MDKAKALRQPALAYQVLEIISSRIANGFYKPGSQLPPEMSLAAEFEVSRATIRRVTDLLVERGLISRRQGIGTFVNDTPGISNPLNQFIDFREMLRMQGYQAGLTELNATLCKPDSSVAEILELHNEGQVIKAHKYFTANDQIVVYCVNHIPTWVFEDVLSIDEVIRPGIMEPILDFYEKRCGKKIEFYTCTVRAEIVRNCGQTFLSRQFKPDLPVLIIDEVGYGKDKIPLHHSVEYHPGNQMKFGLIRLLTSIGSLDQTETIRGAMLKLNERMFASTDPKM